jgi:lipopolysaccharide/colanic/teichoic acid biosynthesis glycosyltransferase
MLKRVIDLGGAGFGLVLLSIPMAAIAVAVRRTMGRPILFIQERPGRRGKIFRLYKFRTMVDVTGPDGSVLPDGGRLTDLGLALRRTSLDELPELINVLKGDMSLVGPRPLLPQYLERYSPEQARRHEVRPGITGLAQVGGRNALSWGEKLRLDVWYVDHWSIGLDLKILWKTLGQVFRRTGISAEGSATMPEFMGEEGPP